MVYCFVYRTVTLVNFFPFVSSVNFLFGFEQWVVWNVLSCDVLCCLQEISRCLKTRKFCSWKQRHKSSSRTSYRKLSTVESARWVQAQSSCWTVCLSVSWLLSQFSNYYCYFFSKQNICKLMWYVSICYRHNTVSKLAQEVDIIVRFRIAYFYSWII